jgi:hypothetical protein
MSRKWKILLSILVAVVVLALGGGAIVMAADGDQPAATTSNPLFAKVATTLGITEQALTDAFKQARTQAENELITNALAKAVENKVITQTESDAIKAWLAQRPASPTKETLKAWWDTKPTVTNQGVYKRFLQAPGNMRRLGYCLMQRGLADNVLFPKVAAILNIDETTLTSAFQKAGAELKQAQFEKALANGITNGKITQDEADQIKSWWGQRPAALDKFAPGFGMQRGGRGMMRGFGGMPCNPQLPANQAVK